MDYCLSPFCWARLQAAARCGPVLGLEMSAETSEYAWDKVERQGDFRRITLFPEVESQKAPLLEVRRRLCAALDEHRPACVAIVGWSLNWSLLALRWCLENQVPTILLSDSTAISNSRSWWKESIKRWLVGLYSVGLVAGSPQRDYLARLGMQPDRIFRAWDVVDNQYFATQSDNARQNASELRGRLGLPENYFVVVNRFIECKNLGRLLEAYAWYRRVAGTKAWKLVLCGDGPLKPQVRGWQEQFGLAQDLILPGFKQYPELPIYYGLSKAFILASTTESWGLVVNEAMASGLPVLVSERCGCSADLVVSGRNGFTFDPGNIQEMARLMLRMAAPETDLAAMGRASREIISDWAPTTWAENLKLATQAALMAPRPSYGVWDRLLLQLLINR